MSKTKAHIVLFFADILGIFLIWWGYHDLHQIILDTSNSVESISFLNRIGFYLLGIGLPLGHLYAICEHFWPAFFRKRNVFFNYAFIVFGLVLFTSAIFLSSYMQHYVEKAGYQYCNGASGVSALAKELVYTKDDETCQQLTAERRKMLGLPSFPHPAHTADRIH